MPYKFVWPVIDTRESRVNPEDMDYQGCGTDWYTVKDTTKYYWLGPLGGYVTATCWTRGQWYFFHKNKWLQDLRDKSGPQWFDSE